MRTFLSGLKTASSILLLSGSSLVLADTPYTGVIKSVDLTTGKVGIAHQGIPPLGMPAMTMKFKYKGDLEKLAVGAIVQFNADKTSVGFEVTEIHITTP